MHEQDMAILRGLIPVAWADGVFEKREKQMLDALLEVYEASDKEKEMLREYAETKRTLDDIEVQDLSADDRRVLYNHAVILSYADGEQSADEVAFLEKLAAKLRIPAAEAKVLMTAGAERAKKHLKLIT
jgi:tellurite resistance protein